MAINQNINSRQKIKGSLSPKLIQAIHQLEKPEIEILDELELEILTETSPEEFEPGTMSDGTASTVDPLGQVSQNIDWDGYLPKDDAKNSAQAIRQQPLHPADRVSMGTTPDLQSHLMRQLIFSKMNIVEKEIGAYLIGNINEIGLLETPIEELHDKEKKYEFKTWQDSLRKIQKFDPPGVAAKNLRECLLIQAKAIKKKNLNGSAAAIAVEIIKEHWDNLLQNKLESLSKKLSVPLSEITEAISIMSQFDLRPGSRFTKKPYFKGNLSSFNYPAFHIRPDFYIFEDGDSFIIEPKHLYLPPLLPPFYHNLLNTNEIKWDDKRLEYRKNKISALIQVLHNRHRNIYKTIESIINHQKTFFRTGSIDNLKPLIAADVASEINLDESTIRRIRKYKYIDTSHGVFPLEFFFDKVGFASSSGKSLTSKCLQCVIHDIIRSENRLQPYSDQEIKDLIGVNYGIEINRRTVLKYREKMCYMPSRIRKCYNISVEC